MKDALLLVDEPAYLIPAYAQLKVPILYLQSHNTIFTSETDTVIKSWNASDFSRLEDIRKEAKKYDLKIKYVSATIDKNLEFAAEVSQALGVPGPCKPSNVHYFLSKLQFKKIIYSQTFAPKSWSSIPSKKHAGSTRFVLKPSKSSGSRNVQILDWEATKRESEKISGAYLIEEFIDGQEFIVDLFRISGKSYLFATGLTFFEEYAPIEKMHVYGPLLPKKTTKRAITILNTVLDQIDHEFGPIHAEFRDLVNPKIIEIHARPAGIGLPILSSTISSRSLVDYYEDIFSEKKSSDNTFSAYAFQVYSKGKKLSNEEKKYLASYNITTTNRNEISKSKIREETNDFHTKISFTSTNLKCAVKVLRTIESLTKICLTKEICYIQDQYCE